MLASGQFATVYPDGKDRVVKMQPSCEKNGIAPYTLRENNLLVDVDHPNIVKCHGINYELIRVNGHGNVDEMFSVATLERCDKPFSYLLEPQVCTPDAVIKFAYQLFDAVSYLHFRHIVHGDLKFENLMFCVTPSTMGGASMELKVIDFNLSQFIFDDQMRTELIQTLPYRAPEVILKHKYYDERVDNWSIGVILMYTVFDHSIGSATDDPIRLLFDYIDVFGVPDSKEWHDMVRQSVVECTQQSLTCLLNESPTPVYAFTVWMKVNIPTKYAKALSRFGQEKLDLLIDLIQQCLTIDAKKRIHASMALKHPLFASIRSKLETKVPHAIPSAFLTATPTPTPPTTATPTPTPTPLTGTSRVTDSSSTPSTATTSRVTGSSCTPLSAFESNSSATSWATSAGTGTGKDVGNDSNRHNLEFMYKMFDECQDHFHWHKNTITIARSLAKDLYNTSKGAEGLKIESLALTILVLALKYNEGDIAIPASIARHFPEGADEEESLYNFIILALDLPFENIIDVLEYEPIVLKRVNHRIISRECKLMLEPFLHYY